METSSAHPPYLSATFLYPATTNYEMDTKRSARPDIFDSSSNTEEPFSINSLIKRVEQFQKMEQLETLKTITLKNSSLQQRIIRYQEHWCLTLDLLHKSQEALIVLQGALNKYLHAEAAAERDRLAQQGIKRNSRNGLEYCPNEWI